MEERLVVWEEDLTTGNGDGVLGTEEHEDQQWLTRIIRTLDPPGTRSLG